MVYLWGGMFHLPLAEDEMYLFRCATINDLGALPRKMWAVKQPVKRKVKRGV